MKYLSPRQLSALHVLHAEKTVPVTDFYGHTVASLMARDAVSMFVAGGKKDPHMALRLTPAGAALLLWADTAKPQDYRSCLAKRRGAVANPRGKIR